MIALVDGDVACYRVGYTTMDSPLGIAKWRLNELLRCIVRDTLASDTMVFLTDSENNFRDALYPEYKAHRTAPKPIWLEELREHCILEWHAKVAVGQEADDAMGITQCSRNGDTIICSIDKDMLQIPGMHYNFVKGEFKEVSPEEGLFLFYHQLLTGDPGDNIKGIQGLGPVKASKLLKGKSTEEELFPVVYEKYLEQFETETKACWELLLTGRLLKIRQKEEELWKFPNIPLTKLLPEVT